MALDGRPQMFLNQHSRAPSCPHLIPRINCFFPPIHVKTSAAGRIVRHALAESDPLQDDVKCFFELNFEPFAVSRFLCIARRSSALHIAPVLVEMQVDHAFDDFGGAWQISLEEKYWFVFAFGRDVLHASGYVFGAANLDVLSVLWVGEGEAVEPADLGLFAVEDGGVELAEHVSERSFRSEFFTERECWGLWFFVL